MRRIAGYIISVFIGLWMVGCAYQPSSHSIQSFLGEKIYIKVFIDKIEPENAPLIKDALHRMVYDRFMGRVVDRPEFAETSLYMWYQGSRFVPISYKDGYAVRYRVYVKARFKIVSAKGETEKTMWAIHEADIQENALNSSTQRILAIRKGVEKALDEFLSYVASRTLMR